MAFRSRCLWDAAFVCIKHLCEYSGHLLLIRLHDLFLTGRGARDALQGLFLHLFLQWRTSGDRASWRVSLTVRDLTVFISLTA